MEDCSIMASLAGVSVADKSALAWAPAVAYSVNNSDLDVRYKEPQMMVATMRCE